MSEKLICASDARKAILNIDPKYAYCIDSIPAVDAVEVVRCKDCQSFKEQMSWVNGYTNKIECCGYCYHWDYEPGSSPNQVDGDDFCSYGERRCDNG